MAANNLLIFQFPKLVEKIFNIIWGHERRELLLLRPTLNLNRKLTYYLDRLSCGCDDDTDDCCCVRGGVAYLVKITKNSSEKDQKIEWIVKRT